jgi:hypothetical protein
VKPFDHLSMLSASLQPPGMGFGAALLRLNGMRRSVSRPAGNPEGQPTRFFSLGDLVWEKLMLKSSYRMLGFASIVGLLPGVPVALAQASRPWVDPPSTLGAPPAAKDALTPDPAPQLDPTATNAIPHPPPRPAPPATGHAVTHPETTARAPEKSEPDHQAAATRDEQEASAKDEPRKAGIRKRSARASRDQRSKTQAAKRQAFAGRSVRERGTDRNALLENGLEIMNLRTIEFPDGRRIKVLMRPDPETIRRVLERPEY